MQIYPLPDLTLTGGLQQVFPDTDAPGATAKWWQVQFATNGSNNSARVGNSSTTATCGVLIAAGVGAGQFAPPIAELTNSYNLSKVYIIGTAGDTIARAYAI